MILVIGATGTNGQHVVRQLLDRAAEVRVFALPDDPKAASLDARVEIFRGSLDRRDALPHVFDGVEAVFLLTANGPNQVQQETNAIDAAAAAGVRRIVKFSTNGSGSPDPDPIAKLHRAMEQHLEQSGLPFTILRNNFFMQNLLWFAPTIKAEGRFRLPMGDASLALVDARDIAAVAAAALTEPGHEGRTYTVTGPEALTFADVAERMSRVLGRPIVYEHVSPETFRSTLSEWGVEPRFADALTATYSRIAQGTQREVTGTVAGIAGKTPFTIDQFAADHSNVFGSAALAS